MIGMPKAKDLSGQRFGKLMAIEPTEKRLNGSVVWRCVCDCGNECEVRSNSLIVGNTKSCGCLRRNRAKTKKGNLGNGKDLAGKKFGMLRAIYPKEERARNEVVWHCECECGNECDVPAYNLAHGLKKSCGCARRADVSGQRFGRLVAIRPTGEIRGTSAVWACRCDCGNEVDVTLASLKRKKQPTRSCGCLRDDTAAATISSDCVDGTKLGILTSKVRSDNTSGIKGVCYDKRKGKWRAYINVKGKRINIGSFDTLEDAAEARRQGETDYFDPILSEHGLEVTSEEEYQTSLANAINSKSE